MLSFFYYMYFRNSNKNENNISLKIRMKIDHTNNLLTKTNVGNLFSAKIWMRKSKLLEKSNKCSFIDIISKNLPFGIFLSLSNAIC